MNLFELDLTTRLNHLLECYEQRFTALFQSKPILADDDKDSVRQFLREWHGSKSQIKLLIDGYFELKDDWVRNNGFPLKFLPKKANAVFVLKAGAQVKKQLYKVGKSESGYDVYSTDPSILNKHTEPG